MHMIKIGVDAYKIKLCKEELEKYIADYSDLTPNSEQTLRLLTDMLSQITLRYARHYMLESMLVEFYPEESGGCYLYLSCRRPGVSQKEKESVTYIGFSNKAHLLQLQNALPVGDLTAYFWEGMYYLPLDAVKCSGEQWREFAQPINLEQTQAALLEEYAQWTVFPAQKEKMQKP